MLCLMLSAQELPQINYEGQNVGSVQVVTDPRVNVETLMPLLAQKAGEPYSKAKVAKSVEALRDATRSPKVIVEVQPTAEGPRLLFIVEPAFYVGTLTFPGAIQKFTYSRLLQVVNVPDESVFDKMSLPNAESALIGFFHNSGYFEAQVHSEMQLDEKNQLANIVFHVTLGKRAKIGKVEVVGTSAPENTRLLHSMQSFWAAISRTTLKTGKTYSPKRIQSATARLKRYLAKHDYLASKVTMRPPQYHPETSRADLSIEVQEGPKVLVTLTGAKLTWVPFLNGRQEKKLVPIFSEGTVDRDLVSEGQRNLLDYFQQKGYFNANVKTSFQRQPDKILIAYAIDKGRRYKVSSIGFRGNQHLSGERLQGYLKVQKAGFFSHGKYSEKLVRQSTDALAAAYKNEGFEDVKVTPHVEQRDGKIEVLFDVAEGPQTTVANLTISGNKAFTPVQLAPSGLKLKIGEAFSPARMNDDRSRILATYLDHGYLNAEVQPSIQRHPENHRIVDVTYAISEHQQVRISQVVFLGQHVTRESLIRKIANVWPETPLSQGTMLESESGLYDLGVFDWSSVGPRKPITNQTDEQALVKVHESKRNSITYGFGFEVSHRGGNVPSGTVAVPGLPTVGLGNAKIKPSESTFASPRGTVEYTRRNLWGMAETGTISVLAARLDQRFLATYSDPHFRESQWSWLLSLTAERTTENPLFTARLGDGSLQFERALDRKKTTRVQLRYDFNRTVLSNLVFPDLVLPEDRAVRLSTFSGTVIRDTRDKPLDAHHGQFDTIDFGVTSSALGSSADFTRLLLQHAFYKPMGPIVWANSIRVGLASPFSSSRVPTSQRFFSGGSTTLRGFPLNGAGPQRLVTVCGNPADKTTCSQISVPVGGNQLFILNSELRFPLPIIKNLGFVTFYDGGNVYRNINFRQFIDDYTNTIGIGLRYNTPIGPVRIDLGHNLNPVPGIKSTQYFITLGQAF